jgi:diamine N-acetyltransferase
VSDSGLVISQAGPGDDGVLHAIAAETFPLACPPGTSEENIQAFIAQNLSANVFASHLVDSQKTIFLATLDGLVVGYAMVVTPPVDVEIHPLLREKHSLELSKIYLLESAHGHGVADALLAEVLRLASEHGCGSVWLGVNKANERANRFYEKNGFEVVGEREFLVGDVLEEDFVREKLL